MEKVESLEKEILDHLNFLDTLDISTLPTFLSSGRKEFCKGLISIARGSKALSTNDKIVYVLTFNLSRTAYANMTHYHSSKQKLFAEIREFVSGCRRVVSEFDE